MSEKDMKETNKGHSLKYANVGKYAELCNVTVNAIYARIANEQIELTENPEGVFGLFIDIEKYPPLIMKRGVKKRV